MWYFSGEAGTLFRLPTRPMKILLLLWLIIFMAIPSILIATETFYCRAGIWTRLQRLIGRPVKSSGDGAARITSLRLSTIHLAFLISIPFDDWQTEMF